MQLYRALHHYPVDHVQRSARELGQLVKEKHAAMG
jgi:hypothetical protein